MTLRVSRLRIRDGSASVRLADGTRFLDVGGLGEDLSAGISRGGDVHIRGELTVDTLLAHLAGAEIGSGLRIRLKHDLGFEAARSLLTINQGTLDLGGVPIDVRGTVTGVRSPAPSLDIVLRGGPAQVSEIVGLIPVRLLPAQARGLRSQGTLSVDGAIRGPAKQADFAINLLLDNGRIEGGVLPQALEGIRFRLRARPDTIDVQEFTAHSGRSSIRGRATLADYQADPTYRVAADADLDLAAISGLLVSPDSLRLSGGLTARVIAEGRTRAPADASLDGLVHLAGIGAQGRALPNPVSDLNGDILLSRQLIGLRNVALRLGTSDLALNGSLAGPLALMPRAAGKGAPPGRARITLALQSRLLDLNPYLEGPRKKFNLALPPADGTIALACERLMAGKIDARNLTGRCVIDHGLVRLDGFSMSTLGGTVGASGTLDLSRSQGSAPGPPRIDIIAEAQQIQVPALFALAPVLGRFGQVGAFLQGALSTHARLSGMLNDSLALDPGSLASEGNLELTNGRLSDQPIQKAVSGFLNLPQLNNLSFQDWKQAFRIENGRLNINGLNLRAGDVEVSANGWQSLDGSLSMNATVLLPKTFSSQVASKLPADAAAVLLSGNDPRIFVPLVLGGRIGSPSVSLDTGQITAAARQQAEARLAQEKQRLEEEARRQAQEILKNKLGLPDSTAARIDSSKIKNEVINKLKNIFGK